MSLEAALLHAKSGMVSQGVRLNVVASNIANANSESSTYGGAYKAKKVIFSQVLDQETGQLLLKASGVADSDSAPVVRFDPGNPLANADGYVFGSNVNVVEEMADLATSTQSYQSNINVANKVNQLMSKTLQMGK